MGTHYGVRPNGNEVFVPRNGIAPFGLQLYLDAGDTESYSGTGTTWTDLTGRGNNGTIVGSPVFADGYFDFTSDSTYISIPNAGLVPRTNDFTYSCWIKFDAFDAEDTIFENGSWTDTLLFRLQNGNTIAVYSESAYVGGFSWTPVIDTWYNIVFIRENNIAKLYVNNTLTGTPFTMTTDINLANPNLFLMRAQYATSQFTNGKLAQFLIYNRALSTSEITSNYAFVLTRFYPIVTAGLVLNLDAGNIASYPGTGTTWTDLTGNGNNGTLVNGPTYSSANEGFIIFDGINDYVNFSTYSQPAYNTTTSFTWNVWVYAGTNNNSPVMGNRQPGLTFTKLTTNNLEYYPTVFGGAMPLSVWQNVCVVKDQTNLYYYRNSSLIASATSSATKPINPFFIGGDPSAGEYANIGVSQSSVYNRALSLTEIQQNFNAIRGRYGI